MKHNIWRILAVTGIFLSGCASKEQVRKTISENPEIVYEAIRKDSNFYEGSAGGGS